MHFLDSYGASYYGNHVDSALVACGRASAHNPQEPINTKPLSSPTTSWFLIGTHTKLQR